MKRPVAQVSVTEAFGSDVDLALAQIEKGLLPSTAERDAEHSSKCSDRATPALVRQTQRSSGTCLETGNYTTVSCGSRALLALRRD